MAEEIENANKQIVVGRTIDGKYIVVSVDDNGQLISKLIGNTKSDGSGTDYYIVTDSSGRIHTRSFRNAAGNGRRMLVDSDRHGQIDVLSSALPSGAAIAANQPVPEHKTYMLIGTSSEQTDDLTPATGKRLRIYGFYGAYTVTASFNPSVAGCLCFGTGCFTDRTKILGASGDVAGASTVIFTMTPMNRLGAVNEIIRFTMATYSGGAGVASANFVILYNEE